jgi:ribosomal protein S16
MAVRIRLTRVGSRKNPIWRIVVADRRSPRDGRVIETIGHYNAQTDPSTIVIDGDRGSRALMRDLVEFLARALVEDPDAVEVTEVEENGDLVVEVTVGGDDLGRLIGKGGRVANAIRTVAKAASTGSDRRVLVEFIED